MKIIVLRKYNKYGVNTTLIFNELKERGYNWLLSRIEILWLFLLEKLCIKYPRDKLSSAYSTYVNMTRIKSYIVVIVLSRFLIASMSQICKIWKSAMCIAQFSRDYKNLLVSIKTLLSFFFW